MQLAIQLSDAPLSRLDNRIQVLQNAHFSNLLSLDPPFAAGAVLVTPSSGHLLNRTYTSLPGSEAYRTDTEVQSSC